MISIEHDERSVDDSSDSSEAGNDFWSLKEVTFASSI
jgi:hypothetical protein